MTHMALNQALIKDLNKKKILRSLWLNYPNSRTGLATATKLNKATITNLVGELEAEGLIVNVGQQNVGVGRMPNLIMLNKNFGLCAGIVISRTTIYIGISNLYAETLWSSKEPFNKNLPPFACLERLAALLREGIAACKDISDNLLGIGISIAGMIRSDTGVMFDTLKNPWENVPVSEFFKQHFHVPVCVDTIANNALMAEYWFGAAQGSKNTLLLFISYGIGAGLLTNGRLYHGAAGFAVDPGHMVIDPSGPVCPCGKKGCWELRGSLLALEGADRDEIIRLAEKGDGDAISRLDSIGRNIGIGISNLVHLFNPQNIIINGDVIACGKWVMNPCEITLQSLLRPYLRDSFTLSFSKLGKKGYLMGAFSRVIETLIT